MAEKDKDAEDIERKLDELDKKFDQDRVRKLYKAKLLQKINAGEVGLLSELEQLKRLERKEAPADAPPPSDDDYGIPERLRIKRRPYTLTPDALAQRKKAAKSDKKVEAMRGNKNVLEDRRARSKKTSLRVPLR